MSGKRAPIVEVLAEWYDAAELFPYRRTVLCGPRRTKREQMRFRRDRSWVNVTYEKQQRTKK